MSGSAYDADHVFSGDLSLGPNGDIALVTGSALSQDRVIRRLFTVPGAYVWNLNYGGGLPTYVGSNVTALEINAVASAQMALEASVAHSPAPTVVTRSDAFGNISATITYTTIEGAQVTATGVLAGQLATSLTVDGYNVITDTSGEGFSA